MSEPDVSHLITVQEAIAILDAVPVELRAQKVNLADALGRYLAQDLPADRDYPAFEKSLMDGFAVRNSDLSNAGALNLVGEVRAGETSSQQLEAGQAMSIMTGAPLPRGADAVVPIEFAQRQGNRVQVTKAGDYTRFVAHSGSDCRAGTVVLQRGIKLGAAQLAVAATIGAAEIEVYDHPRVAILATGDELIGIDQNPQRHQIRNSNSTLLQALLRGYGCAVTDLGMVRDEMAPMIKAIESGLKFDALFITGGMSVGAYDLPPRALAQLSAEILITKLKIKPGKPFIYARLGGCQIFGLPGNPLAGFVCTERLASRVLRRMMVRRRGRMSGLRRWPRRCR